MDLAWFNHQEWWFSQQTLDFTTKNGDSTDKSCDLANSNVIETTLYNHIWSFTGQQSGNNHLKDGVGNVCVCVRMPMSRRGPTWMWTISEVYPWMRNFWLAQSHVHNAMVESFKSSFKAFWRLKIPHGLQITHHSAPRWVLTWMAVVGWALPSPSCPCDAVASGRLRHLAVLESSVNLTRGFRREILKRQMLVFINRKHS